MPQLPDPNALNRLSANPGTTVATYTPGQVGAALEKLGGTVANQANNLQYVIAREKDHLDKMRVQDALNQLETQQQEMTLGENGYRRKLGGDVLTPDYTKSYASAFDTAVAGLGTKLTPQQRVLFDQNAKQQKVQFQAGMMQHAMGQATDYEKQIFNDTLTATQNAAAVNWADPKAVESQLVKANVLIADRLDRLGMKDPTIRAVQAKEVEGGVHSAVIVAALNADNAGYAKSYFDTNKEFMTPQQVKAVEGQIKPATDFARGRDLGTEAFKMLQSGKSAVDVEAYLVSKADTPGIHQQAQSIYGQLTQAVKVQDANAKGSIIEKFSLAGANGAAMNSVLNSPEYRALTPEQRGPVAEYMRGQARATGEFYRVQNDRANAKKAEDPKVYAAFLDTLESPEFTSMSRAEIYAMAPTVGPQLVKQLLAEQKNQQSGVAKFQIDSDLFNGSVPASAQGDAQKTRAYKGVVESKLQEFLETEKRKPTLDEQKALLRTGSEVYIEAGRVYGTNEREAYQLTPGRPSYPAAFASQAKGVVGDNPEKLADAWGFVDGMRTLARIKKMKVIPTEAEALVEYMRQQPAATPQPRTGGQSFGDSLNVGMRGFKFELNPPSEATIAYHNAGKLSGPDEPSSERVNQIPR